VSHPTAGPTNFNIALESSKIAAADGSKIDNDPGGARFKDRRNGNYFNPEAIPHGCMNNKISQFLCLIKVPLPPG
jgi:hypothetical protein